MLTENLSSQPAGIGFADTNSIKRQMLEQMQDSKEYRHGFIEEAIRSRLVGQITALRKERGWDLKTFAEKIGKKVSWIYRLEDPNAPPPTIPSLLEVAEAHDVGLDVRFRPFSELLDEVTNLTPRSFLVPSFSAELKAGNFSTRRKRKPRRVKNDNKSTRSLHRRAKSVERKPPVKEISATRGNKTALRNAEQPTAGFGYSSGNNNSNTLPMPFKDAIIQSGARQ